MFIIKRMASLVNSARIKSARLVFDCAAWNPTESEWLRSASGVQEDEKVRIGKFVYGRDAKHSMVGRLLMRKFIVDSTGLDWNTISITRDANNKPVFVDGNFSVQFNVSHQGDYAVLAGELGANKIGVDVMKIEYSGGKHLAEFFRIMNRQFSDYEWSVIKSQTTEWDQLTYFYRFWCLKESYVKATGTGITVNLKQISFKLNSPLKLNSSSEFVVDTELFLDGVKQDNWTFQEILIGSEHCCAVALNVPTADHVRSPHKVENFKLLNFNELVKDLKPITPPDLSYCREFLSKEVAPF